MKKVLISWIGHTDLKASRGEDGGLGPLRSAIASGQYRAVELISNYPRVEVDALVEWLNGFTDAPIAVHDVTLSSPMDFGEVYEAADRVVADVLKKGTGPLVFHLSPGTSAMTAMWLVLATTKYPAQLILSSKETGVYTPEFPFEIAADYLPRKRAAAVGGILTSLFDERTPAAFDKIIHRCELMKHVIAKAQKVAQFEVPVMILGESGTGKELFAEAIHHASSRTTGPFVPVNCGAIPKDLVEAELFGHTRGAFTGSAGPRKGFLEQADGGTLFLDELGELPSEMQVKLLRVLQHGEVRPIGSEESVHVDLRIVSATNRDLQAAVAAGTFREDLFHRLAVGVITLPPLRKRTSDLSPLIEFHREKLKSTLSRSSGYAIPTLSAGALSVLSRHPWTGNIRELFNTLTRAVIWSDTETIGSREIEAAILSVEPARSQCTILNREIGPGFSLHDTLREVEAHFVTKALAETRTKRAAAEALGLASAAALRHKIESLGLDE